MKMMTIPGQDKPLRVLKAEALTRNGSVQVKR